MMQIDETTHTELLIFKAKNKCRSNSEAVALLLEKMENGQRKSERVYNPQL